MAMRDQRPGASGRRARLRRFVYQLRTERSGPRRDSIAVALGVFIGCTPLYGLHLLISLVAADLFRLNRLKVYLAANISNPFVFPFLVVAEVQTGAWLRRGRMHALTREAITAVDPWTFGLDLVVGSIAVGAVLGVALGLLTYVALRRRDDESGFTSLVERAAERYAASGITAWEFANAKLRFDPVYRLAMTEGRLPGGDTLVDIGCGQGLMLAVLLEGREAAPGTTGWPTYAHLVGIDTRPRVARIATEALAGPGVEILTADVREGPLPRCSAVLLFDVLHMMPAAAQITLLAAVKAALQPDGVVLVREADAAGGWRFTAVRVGNRLKALVGRRWDQPFAFRQADGWLECFREAGFRADVVDDPSRGPFGNVLFRLTLMPSSPPRGNAQEVRAILSA